MFVVPNASPPPSKVMFSVPPCPLTKVASCATLRLARSMCRLSFDPPPSVLEIFTVSSPAPVRLCWISVPLPSDNFTKGVPALTPPDSVTVSFSCVYATGRSDISSRELNWLQAKHWTPRLRGRLYRSPFFRERSSVSSIQPTQELAQNWSFADTALRPPTKFHFCVPFLQNHRFRSVILWEISLWITPKASAPPNGSGRANASNERVQRGRMTARPNRRT